MSEESLNIERCLKDGTTNNNDTVVVVAQLAAEKALITSKESFKLSTMKVAKDFFEVLPFRASDVTAYLLWSEPCQAQALDLMLRNVVIKDNHAAVFVFGRTSRAIPCWLKVSASCTASAETKPRYSWAM